MTSILRTFITAAIVVLIALSAGALPLATAQAQIGSDAAAINCASGNEDANADCRNASQAEQLETEPGWWSWAGGRLMSVIASLAFGILSIFGLLMKLAGKVFEMTLQTLVIGMADLINTNAAINIGWTVMRDIANAVFLFIIIFIGIMTILRASGYQWKRMLGYVIAAAILVNFSMIFTKVVIDVTNVMAYEIYRSFGISPACTDTVMTNNAANGCYNTGITIQFMNQFGLQSILAVDFANTDPDNQVDSYKLFLVSMLGIPFVIVAAFVFIAGAIFLVMRFVVLVIVIVFSPLAFAALAIPSMNKYWRQWVNQLLKQSFFAPAYLLMLWLALKMAEGIAAASAGGTASQLYPGTNTFFLAITSKETVNPGVLNIVLYFTLISIFMIMALIVARMFGVWGANTVIGWGHSARRNAWRYTNAVGGKASRYAENRASRPEEGWKQAYKEVSERDKKYQKVTGAMALTGRAIGAAALSIPGARRAAMNYGQNYDKELQRMKTKYGKYSTNELDRLTRNQLTGGRNASDRITPTTNAAIAQIAAERNQVGQMNQEFMQSALKTLQRYGTGQGERGAQAIARQAPYLIEGEGQKFSDALDKALSRQSRQDIENMSWDTLRKLRETDEKRFKTIMDGMAKNYNGGQAQAVMQQFNDLTDAFTQNLVDIAGSNDRGDIARTLQSTEYNNRALARWIESNAATGDNGVVRLDSYKPSRAKGGTP